MYSNQSALKIIKRHFPICKDKLFTHSFCGFVNYAKFNLLQHYKTDCTIANCYVLGYTTNGKTLVFTDGQL